MLMHAIARGGCTNSIRASALKADWEKNPLLHRGIEPQSVLHLAVWSDALPTELSHPDDGSFHRQKDHCNYRIYAHAHCSSTTKVGSLFFVINRYLCTYDEILKLWVWVALSVMVGTSALRLMSCFKMWAEIIILAETDDAGGRVAF